MNYIFQNFLVDQAQNCLSIDFKGNQIAHFESHFPKFSNRVCSELPKYRHNLKSLFQEFTGRAENNDNHKHINNGNNNNKTLHDF